MTAQELKRKLTAILSADVEGYSRLMGENEVATVRTLTAHRDAMIKLIHTHRGRVVDAPGDNLLAEFAGVVNMNLLISGVGSVVGAAFQLRRPIVI